MSAKGILNDVNNAVLGFIPQLALHLLIYKTINGRESYA